MRLRARLSRHVRDRRWRAAGLAGAVAAVLAMLGLRARSPDPQAELVEIVSGVLDDLQAEMRALVEGRGAQWRPVEVVLYAGHTGARCGAIVTDAGPLYCGADERVYLDLAYLERARILASDGAVAFVVAHEVAHHAQRVLARDTGRSSVEVELEADCLAGWWLAGVERRGLLDAGDMTEVAIAVAALGADPLSETRTHGTAGERTSAVQRGAALGGAWGAGCLQPRGAP